MAYRATCESLIRRLRGMIGDRIAAGSTTAPTWSDIELQDALDGRRVNVDTEPLTSIVSYPSGVSTYLTFEHALSNFEEDATLVNASYTAITPATYDYLNGRFTFSAEPSYPVYLTGKSFDLRAAAADVLEQWAALVKLDFNFSEGRTGGQFQREQKHKMLLASAATHRAQQRVTTATMYRSDVAGGNGRSEYLEMLRR